MGWSFNWSPSFGKEDLINRFLSKGFFVEGCSVIDSRITGSAFWAVLEHEGKRAIWLALLAPGGKDEGYASLVSQCAEDGKVVAQLNAMVGDLQPLLLYFRKSTETCNGELKLVSKGDNALLGYEAPRRCSGHPG